MDASPDAPSPKMGSVAMTVPDNERGCGLRANSTPSFPREEDAREGKAWHLKLRMLDEMLDLRILESLNHTSTNWGKDIVSHTV